MLSFDAGDVQAEVLPDVGGRIHRIRAFGVDLLRTPDDVDVHRRSPFLWGAFPMVPWCNRVPKAEFEFDGQRYELPVNFPDGTAIHGETYDRPWRVDGEGHLHFEGGRDGGYPWPYHADLAVAVTEHGVTVDLRAVNDHDAPIPLGVGWHPWFTARPGLAIAVPAALVYDTEHTLPIGDPVLVRGERDLRPLRPPAWELDTTWTALAHHHVTLQWPKAGLGAALSFSAAADHVVVAAFASLHAVAVEPQTHAPDGFGRLARGQPGAIAVVAPGAAVDVRYELVIARSAR